MILLWHTLKGIISRLNSQLLDVDGKPLLGLHPRVEILAFCKMDQQMEDALKRQMDTKQAWEEAKYDLMGFFTHYKKIPAHPLLKNVFVKLTDNDQPTMTITKLIDQEFTMWDQADNKGPQIVCKFVIYLHLSQSWTLMQHVLGLRGIASDHVNGSMSQSDHDTNVQAFMQDNGPEVIVLSNVGTARLNLQDGSIVIYLEQQVYIYQLVVPNPPDEFLLGYTASKGLMMQLFKREVKHRGLPGFEPEVFEAIISGATTAQGKPVKACVDACASKTRSRTAVATKSKAKEVGPPAKQTQKPTKGQKGYVDPKYPQLSLYPGGVTINKKDQRAKWNKKPEILKSGGTIPDSSSNTNTSPKPGEPSKAALVALIATASHALPINPANDQQNLHAPAQSRTGSA
ncbi:hypothetical protein FRC07_002227 [Ceratobasidium sp. 392]|nr:hypothetical protein FRC07_002227 [Ceratobasidium sp. 392]